MAKNPNEIPPWLLDDDDDSASRPPSKPSKPSRPTPLSAPPPAAPASKPRANEAAPWLSNIDQDETGEEEMLKGGQAPSADWLASGDFLAQNIETELTYDEWYARQQEAKRERSIEEEIPEFLDTDDLSKAVPTTPAEKSGTGALPDWFLGMETLSAEEEPEWVKSGDKFATGQEEDNVPVVSQEDVPDWMKRNTDEFEGASIPKFSGFGSDASDSGAGGDDAIQSFFASLSDDSGTASSFTTEDDELPDLSGDIGEVSDELPPDFSFEGLFEPLPPRIADSSEGVTGLLPDEDAVPPQTPQAAPTPARNPIEDLWGSGDAFSSGDAFGEPSDQDFEPSFGDAFGSVTADAGYETIAQTPPAPTPHASTGKPGTDDLDKLFGDILGDTYDAEIEANVVTDPSMIPENVDDLIADGPDSSWFDVDPQYDEEDEPAPDPKTFETGMLRDLDSFFGNVAAKRDTPAEGISASAEIEEPDLSWFLNQPEIPVTGPLTPPEPAQPEEPAPVISDENTLSWLNELSTIVNSATGTEAPEVNPLDTSEDFFPVQSEIPPTPDFSDFGITPEDDMAQPAADEYEDTGDMNSPAITDIFAGLSMQDMGAPGDAPARKSTPPIPEPSESLIDASSTGEFNWDEAKPIDASSEKESELGWLNSLDTGTLQMAQTEPPPESDAEPLIPSLRDVPPPRPMLTGMLNRFAEPEPDDADAQISPEVPLFDEPPAERTFSPLDSDFEAPPLIDSMFGGAPAEPEIPDLFADMPSNSGGWQPDWSAGSSQPSEDDFAFEPGDFIADLGDASEDIPSHFDPAAFASALNEAAPDVFAPEATASTPAQAQGGDDDFFSLIQQDPESNLLPDAEDAHLPPLDESFEAPFTFGTEDDNLPVEIVTDTDISTGELFDRLMGQTGEHAAAPPSAAVAPAEPLFGEPSSDEESFGDISFDDVTFEEPAFDAASLGAELQDAAAQSEGDAFGVYNFDLFDESHNAPDEAPFERPKFDLPGTDELFSELAFEDIPSTPAHSDVPMPVTAAPGQLDDDLRFLHTLPGETGDDTLRLEHEATPPPDPHELEPGDEFASMLAGLHAEDSPEAFASMDTHLMGEPSSEPLSSAPIPNAVPDSFFDDLNDAPKTDWLGSTIPEGDTQPTFGVESTFDSGPAYGVPSNRSTDEVAFHFDVPSEDEQAVSDAPGGDFFSGLSFTQEAVPEMPIEPDSEAMYEPPAEDDSSGDFFSGLNFDSEPEPETPAQGSEESQEAGDFFSTLDFSKEETASQEAPVEPVVTGSKDTGNFFENFEFDSGAPPAEPEHEEEPSFEALFGPNAGENFGAPEFEAPPASPFDQPVFDQAEFAEDAPAPSGYGFDFDESPESEPTLDPDNLFGGMFDEEPEPEASPEPQASSTPAFSSLDEYLSSLNPDGTPEVTPETAAILNQQDVDLDKLFSEGLPAKSSTPTQSGDLVPSVGAEWLSEIQAQVGEVSATAIVRQREDKPEGELPDRLKRLRQREKSVAEKISQSEEPPPEKRRRRGKTGQTEEMDALKAILPGAPALAAAPLQADKLTLATSIALTAEQENKVALLRSLVRTSAEPSVRGTNRLSAIEMTYDTPFMRDLEDTEDAIVHQTQTSEAPKVGESPAQKVIPRAKVRRKRRYDRFFVAVALVLAMTAPFFIAELRIGQPPSTIADGSAGAAAAFQQIDTINHDDYVLMAVEYGPSAAGELDRMTDALLRHVLLRGGRPVLISTNPFGVLRATYLIDSINEDSAFINAIAVPGGALLPNLDYYAIRYLAGGMIGLRAFAEQPVSALSVDINGAPTGLQARALGDFSRIIVITDNPDDLRTYAEQIAPLANTPLIAAASYAAAPVAETYTGAALTFGALLVGGQDASAYQAALNEVGALARGERLPTPTPTGIPAGANGGGIQPNLPVTGMTVTVTAAQAINVRSGAGTGFDIVTRASPGDILPVIEFSSDSTWIHVVLPDGRDGWVSASLIRLNVPEGSSYNPDSKGYARRQSGDSTPEPDAAAESTAEATAEATAESTAEATVEPAAPPINLSLTFDTHLTPESIEAQRGSAFYMGIVASSTIIVLGAGINIVRGLRRRGRR